MSLKYTEAKRALFQTESADHGRNHILQNFGWSIAVHDIFGDCMVRIEEMLSGGGYGTILIFVVMPLKITPIDNLQSTPDPRRSVFVNIDCQSKSTQLR